MKNGSASSVKMYISPKLAVVGVENTTTSHRQPRFYGPLLGLVLSNLFLNSAIAKYAPLGSLRVSYDPSPWLAYNKPNHHNTHHQYDPDWKPLTPSSIALDDDYGPPNSPSPSKDDYHIYHHHHVFPGQQQIVNINERPPTQIEIDTNRDPIYPGETSTSHHEDLISAESNIYTVTTRPDSISNLNDKVFENNTNLLEDLTPAESNFRRNVYKTTSRKRANPQKYIANKRKSQYNRKRFGVATTERNNYFYDNYDYDYGGNQYGSLDYTTRRYNSKRRKFSRNPAYYDDTGDNAYDYDDDYYDYTTKVSRRKRPLQSKTSRRKINRRRQEEQRQDDYSEFDDDVESVTPSRRQKQQSTTMPTTTNPPVTPTEIVNGSTPAPMNTTTSSSNTTSKGYGYGPSNGNENISITYGPPHSAGGGGYIPSRPQQAYGPPHTSYGVPSASGQYQVPYSEWYNQEGVRNGFGRVEDVISLDGVFQQRKFK